MNVNLHFVEIQLHQFANAVFLTIKDIHLHFYVKNMNLNCTTILVIFLRVCIVYGADENGMNVVTVDSNFGLASDTNVSVCGKLVLSHQFNT